ncbi:S1/P1 nuclease, partial [Penicillium daleae]
LIDVLLPSSDREDISDAVVWADAIRPDFLFTRPWHFINCGSAGCIVSAIQNIIAEETRSIYASTVGVVERRTSYSISDTDIPYKINGLKYNLKYNEEKEPAARETNRLNCDYVLKNGVNWLEDNNLGGDYYVSSAPIVNKQIYKAGVRLAT